MKVKKIKNGSSGLPLLFPDGEYQLHPKAAANYLGIILVNGFEVAFRTRTPKSVTKSKPVLFLSLTTKGFPFISSVYLRDYSGMNEENYFGEDVVGVFEYLHHPSNNKVYYSIILNLDAGRVQIRRKAGRVHYEY